MSLLRHVLVVVTVVTVLLFATIVPVGTAMARPRDPFVGAWTAIDEFDGSFMQLKIGGEGGGHRFNYFDHGGGVCQVFDEDGNPTIPAVLLGTGTHPEDDPDLLELEGPVWCLYRDGRGRTLVWESVVVSLEYIAATDTLAGGGGVWSRVGA